MKSCVQCGREFSPRSNRQKWCGLCGRQPVGPGRYGAAHRRLRTQVGVAVAAGRASCSRCGLAIEPGEPFDLDHADDGSGYLGVAHSSCNRAVPSLRRRYEAEELLEDNPERGDLLGSPDAAWWASVAVVAAVVGLAEGLAEGRRPVTARDRLAGLFAPEALEALEELVAAQVDARLRVLSAGRIAGRQRPDFLTVQEAADVLRADRQRVYDLVSSGRLTRHKDGSRVLVRRAELEAYLNGNGGP